MEEQDRRPRLLIAVTIVLVALLSSLATAVYFLRYYEKPAYTPLMEMADTIENQYYYADETINDESLIENALRGMIYGIGDDYADYMTKEEYDELLRQDSAEYRGIGISVSLPDETGSLILKVYEGSPAAEAGVAAGDVIINANGISSAGLSMNAFLDTFSAEEDESDTLTLQRGEETYTVTLFKREVAVPRVFFEQLPDGKGFIRIDEFAGGVVTEFSSAIKQLTADGAESIIIDLRNNPGGGLTEVLGTLDCILEKGAPIATIKNRAGREDVYKAETAGIDLPIAVLVNGLSASGSEMFTGALKDNHRAVIIGTQTFGKGIVQSYFRLRSNGGWVKLTTDAYYTPSGICIQDEGVTPDIVLEQPDPDGDGYTDFSALAHADDVQLQEAIRQLNSQQLKGDHQDGKLH